jgi:hypothetical protein
MDKAGNIMELRIENGLLFLTCWLEYGSRETLLQNVLVDTGCAVSIFDIDLMENLGLKPKPESARIVKMYGVGGKSEYCLEQHIQNLVIGGHTCRHFRIQLGPISNDYGFDAILGNDFLMASGLTLDLANLLVFEQKKIAEHFLN